MSTSADFKPYDVMSPLGQKIMGIFDIAANSPHSGGFKSPEGSPEQHKEIGELIYGIYNFFKERGYSPAIAYLMLCQALFNLIDRQKDVLIRALDKLPEDATPDFSVTSVPNPESQDLIKSGAHFPPTSNS